LRGSALPELSPSIGEATDAGLIYLKAPDAAGRPIMLVGEAVSRR
jgi:hypothetical protein